MFDIEIHGIKKASEKEKKRFSIAVEYLVAELNDDSFWDEVGNNYKSWKYKKLVSFEDFKEQFLSGRDSINNDIDHDLDIYVTFYYSFRSVVGYTRPSTWFTWINRKMLSTFNYSDIAGNIAHEYLHNMGFDHPNTDKESLVYQFGYLVRDRITKKTKTTRAIYKRYVPWYKRLLNYLKMFF